MTHHLLKINERQSAYLIGTQLVLESYDIFQCFWDAPSGDPTLNVPNLCYYYRKGRRKEEQESQNPTPIKKITKLILLADADYHQHQTFCNTKNILRGINFVKITKKDFPSLIQNLATLVWFLCNIHAATNSGKNYKKIQKKTGGELICKNFGVNGR